MFELQDYVYIMLGGRFVACLKKCFTFISLCTGKSWKPSTRKTCNAEVAKNQKTRQQLNLTCNEQNFIKQI